MIKKVRSNISKDKLKTIDSFYNHLPEKLKLKNVNTIVLHWTSSTKLDESISKLKKSPKLDGKNGVNYHFVIDKDGTIVQTAPLTSKVYHAGYSYGPKGISCNEYSYSIGIVGIVKNFDEVINSVAELIKDIQNINPNIKYITGHHQISPGRKGDPYNFDFDKVVKKIGNITYWKIQDEKNFPANPKGLTKKGGKYFYKSYEVNPKNLIDTAKKYSIFTANSFYEDDESDESDIR